MTEHDVEGRQAPRTKTKQRKRLFIIVIGTILLLLLLLFIVMLILSLTVFKPKQPRTKLQSARVDGISPRVTFPAINIQINLTLDLQILVNNQNYASFKHGVGSSVLLYRGGKVGEAAIEAGFIPARGSTTLPARLTLQLDQFASNLTALISDILGGNLAMETRTQIPGRINFLGIFKKHVVASSDCQFTIGFPDIQIRKQECKNKTLL